MEKQRKAGGRPRSQNLMMRTQVVLPRPMRDALQLAADGNNRGLSAEIRERLQASYDLERVDPRTVQLMQNSQRLAGSLASDLGGQWLETDFGRKALLAGIAVFLQEYAPEADRVRDKNFTGYPDDAPHDVIGQTHARFILREQRRGASK